jgi:starch synthase
MKALVVHPGTQHAFRLAAQMERCGCLSRFWTGFAYIPDSMLGRCVESLPMALQRSMAGRRLGGLPTAKLRTQPLVDLRALCRLRAGHDEQAVMFERNEAFQRGIPQQELANSDVVIGVDTASWLLADQTSALGRHFILDRTIGHPLAFQQLLPVLRNQFPEWTEDFPDRLSQLKSAEDSEHRLAHRIAVGSSFTRRTLIENGVPSEKIFITPLGIDLGVFTPVPRPDLSRPIRFVFLGSLGVRKGVPLLLQVWQSLGSINADLWLAGPLTDRNARLIPPLPGLRVMGKVSRRELPGLLRQCDVLVFPSYFEGFGAVLLEAMAAGLPIIATEATGAPDLITNGVEGYVIPTGNARALKNAMQRFIDSPDYLASMSQAARRCAERYSWDAYGDRWMDILQHVTCAARNAPAPSDSARGTVLGGAGASRAGAFEVGHSVQRLRSERTSPGKSGPMKALLVHPGTQYSFQLAGQLQSHGCLSRFWTGVAYVPESPLGRCLERLPKRVQRQLSNRRLEGVSTDKICTRPFGEWWALRRLRAGQDHQTVMFERNAAFQSCIPQRDLADSNVVIGFDTSSWLLAERASALGRTFILDRSIAHPLNFQRVLQTLRHQFPEWVQDVPPRLPELLLAEETEHRKAARIVVPSSFVRRTLIENGVPSHKITMIPFGVDLNAFRPLPRPNASRPLRFVFLGSLGARKGVPLLLQTWRSLAPITAELWLVGPVSERHARLIPQLPGLRLIDKVPHRELPSLLGQCDVLVFPSYFEGLAQVQLEGLAAGLPIIGTEASGASDLITDGIEGYIVPTGDAEALREAMLKFIESPGYLATMSPAARLCAERYSWDAYGDRWMGLLEQVVYSADSCHSISDLALRG